MSICMYRSLSFYKKADTQGCVSFNSCHPKQCKGNIPVTLAT